MLLGSIENLHDLALTKRVESICSHFVGLKVFDVRVADTREPGQKPAGVYECIACGFQTSIVAGTIFQDTKKALSLLFRAIWHMTSQKYGTNALGLQRFLGLGSYRTTWTWLHKLRQAMVRPGRERLSGIVEVDESYIGGKKSGKRGRGAAGKTLVVIAADLDGPGIGRIRLRRVIDAFSESIEHTIEQGVEPRSVVRTDWCKGYNRLNSLGYIHEVVREQADVGNNLLPSRHPIAGLLKRWLMGTHQGAVSHEHLDYYLHRIHVSLQPTDLSVSRQAVLPPITTGDSGGTWTAQNNG